MSKYAVIIERASARNFSGHVPDLPGCVATGATQEECARVLAEAIEFHLEGMREDGDPVPEPSTYAAMLEVAA